MNNEDFVLRAGVWTFVSFLEMDMGAIEDAVGELQDVFGILAADVEEARKFGQRTPTRFAHRTLFRTYFALIEGLAFQLRIVTGVVNEYFPGRLEAGESELLRDFRYTLNDKGEPYKAQHFQKTLPSILFTIRCYAKVYGVSFPMPKDDPGYQAFKEFVKLRNGLTHPKCIADLEPTEAQIRKAADAAIWWQKTAIKLVEACRAQPEE